MPADDGRSKRKPKANIISIHGKKKLVKFLVQQDALGRPVRIKYLGVIAFNLACRRRALTDKPRKALGRN
jgi:hypothetical protein